MSAVSSIRKLSSYLDEKGVMRMSGRIDNASNVRNWTKRPIILPPRHKITEMIVADYDEKFLHANNETVM